MKNIIHFLNSKIFFPSRAKDITRRVSKYLKNLEGVKRVLDIGSSDGYLASQLSKETGITIEGIDVLIQPKTYIEIKKYDGETIPFNDNTFDCVLITDVLHHTTDIEKVLAEAKRVSRKHILIKDVYHTNPFDLFSLIINDYWGNKIYGIALPYNFPKLSQWYKIFENLKLKLMTEYKYKRIPVIGLGKQVIFVLGK